MTVLDKKAFSFRELVFMNGFDTALKEKENKNTENSLHEVFTS